MTRRRPAAASGSRWGAPPWLVLLAVFAGAGLVTAWTLWLDLHMPSPVPWMSLVAHCCGMLAGYGVVILIGLMSRSPALERGVGADRLARWHSRSGSAVVVLALAHAVAVVLAWARVRHEDDPLAMWQVARLPWLVAATIGTVTLVLVAVASIRAARRAMSFERWHHIHLLVYVAVALGFVHQLAGPDLAGHRVVQVMWALLYAQVFAMVLRHRVLTPMRNATWHRLRVAEVIEEGPGAVSVVVEGHRLEELRAASGQFFRWRFLTPDLWSSSYPFSLSAAPTSTRLRLTVKALGDGSTLVQRIEPGTWVIAEGPFGAVTADCRRRRDVLLIAGGVGITPMRALFESMPMREGADLMLLYRARCWDDVLFRDELDHIALLRGARVEYLVGDEVAPFSPTLLHTLVPGLVERDVYLCGPPRMTAAARRALRLAGHSDAHLHEERFAY